MSKGKITRLLGDWKGYRVGTVQRLEASEARKHPEVWIELIPIRRRRMRCSGCGRLVCAVHDYVERWVRDLPVFDAATHLLVLRRRVHCPVCGPKLEQLPWLDRYSRVTRRLAESVVRLCRILPIKHIAECYGLNWKTVKTIDKRYLTEKLNPIDLKGVKVVAMDEFAIRKGHRYATIIVEPYTKRVLWVGRGNSRESIRPFFELLGRDGCARIEAVAMDMNGAYAAEVKAQCPKAEIVYDLFHVVAKYGREVIDRVRNDEANRLNHDKDARKVVKGSRWLLLRNRRNLMRQEDRIRLYDLLRANKDLMKVYILKEDLKRLWDYRDSKAAKRFWKGWYRRAMQSRVEPLIKFAKRLKPYISGIISHCRYPLHTSLLEGINNKIKVIKRMAYGFLDDEYFFLKIRAAFPGIGR
ncbi:ISL3-like element ISBma1 family transposase [Desulfobaculum senezii]